MIGIPAERNKYLNGIFLVVLVREQEITMRIAGGAAEENDNMIRLRLKRAYPGVDLWSLSKSRKGEADGGGGDGSGRQRGGGKI